MSAYADSVLATGEKIVYRASISRWKFLPSYLAGALLMAAGAFALYATGFGTGPKQIGAILPLLAGVAILVSAIIRRRTTELVLTDRRIIAKRGLVSRDTVEMNLSKVESLHVNQGLMGRLLDYGDVTVVGTGSSLEPLLGIAHPLELRKKLGEVADGSASVKTA